MNHVLIDRDSDRSEAVLRFLSGNPVALERVAKEEMVLRSRNLGPAFLQFVGAGIGILEDGFHVSLEGRVEGFPEGHGFPGDDMLQGAALSIGEDRRIEFLVEALVARKDEPAPGSPEGLVGRRGDDVRVLAGAVAEPRRDDAGDVGHVDHEEGMGSLPRVVLVDEAAHSREIDLEGIGRVAGQEKGRVHLVEEDGEAFPYSFAQVTAQLDESVLTVSKLSEKLIELAQVEKTCNMLAIEIEKNRRRVNALEYVLIPQTEETIRYITMKLDENERSATVRLMKVKSMIEDK